MLEVSGNLLVKAHRLLEQRERRVASQRQLVEGLKADGHKAARAEEVILRTMKDAVRQMRQELPGAERSRT